MEFLDCKIGSSDLPSKNRSGRDGCDREEIILPSYQEPIVSRHSRRTYYKHKVLVFVSFLFLQKRLQLLSEIIGAPLWFRVTMKIFDPQTKLDFVTHFMRNFTRIQGFNICNKLLCSMVEYSFFFLILVKILFPLHRM